MLVSTAVVTTDAPARYAKQLLAHLGHKVHGRSRWTAMPDGGRLVFAYGTGTVRVPVRQAACWMPAAGRRRVAGPGPGRAGPAPGAVRCAPRARASPGPPAGRADRAGVSLSAIGRHGRPPMRVIHTDDAPSHTGPVPQAVEAGGWIFVSALFGADPGDHAFRRTPRAEAEQLFDNLAPSWPPPARH